MAHVAAGAPAPAPTSAARENDDLIAELEAAGGRTAPVDLVDRRALPTPSAASPTVDRASATGVADDHRGRVATPRTQRPSAVV